MCGVIVIVRQQFADISTHRTRILGTPSPTVPSLASALPLHRGAAELWWTHEIALDIKPALCDHRDAASAKPAADVNTTRRRVDGPAVGGPPDKDSAIFCFRKGLSGVSALLILVANVFSLTATL